MAGLRRRVSEGGSPGRHFRGFVGILAVVALVTTGTWWFSFRGTGVQMIIENGGIEDACPARGLPASPFADVADTNPHERAIGCAVDWEIVSPGADFRPAEPVTRGQLATLLARVVDGAGGSLPSDAPDRFGDDDDSPHEDAINAVAEAGIVSGAGGGRYAPNAAVTRAQAATFLVRTYEHIATEPLAEGTNRFTDDDTNPHEDAINAAADARLLSGVGDDRFAPQLPVRRDQMVTLLVRLLDRLVEQNVTTPPPS